MRLNSLIRDAIYEYRSHPFWLTGMLSFAILTGTTIFAFTANGATPAGKFTQPAPVIVVPSSSSPATPAPSTHAPTAPPPAKPAHASPSSVIPHVAVRPTQVHKFKPATKRKRTQKPKPRPLPPPVKPGPTPTVTQSPSPSPSPSPSATSTA